MIVVDTSVWVSALRSRAAPEAAVLNALLDADEVALAVPVRVELLSGVSRAGRAALARSLSALPLLYPTDGTWRLIGEWTARAGPGGERFGVFDLLIAGLASEAGALVWSLDRDFTRMSRMKLVELYEP